MQSCVSALAQPSTQRAIIIGENVNVRSFPDVSGTKRFQLSSGTLVEVLDQSALAVDLYRSGDKCEEFPWIKLATPSGKEGWMYGKYVYRVLDEPSQLKDPARASFSLGDNIWQLALCQNYGPGAMNESGLTGCEDFSVVLLYTDNWRKTQLVPLADAPHSSFPIWNLQSDSGVEEKITYIEPEETLSFHIECSFQEGKASYDITITEKKGKPVAQIKNYQTQDR